MFVATTRPRPSFYNCSQRYLSFLFADRLYMQPPRGKLRTYPRRIGAQILERVPTNNSFVHPGRMMFPMIRCSECFLLKYVCLCVCWQILHPVVYNIYVINKYCYIAIVPEILGNFSNAPHQCPFPSTGELYQMLSVE